MWRAPWHHSTSVIPFFIGEKRSFPGLTLASFGWCPCLKGTFFSDQLGIGIARPAVDSGCMTTFVDWCSLMTIILWGHAIQYIGDDHPVAILVTCDRAWLRISHGGVSQPNGKSDIYYWPSSGRHRGFWPWHLWIVCNRFIQPLKLG